MHIVVLTGAGISAESGVPTFRDSDGLWVGHRIEDVCTPEALEYQPSVVQRFYDDRRAFLSEVVPNPAHLALARLEEYVGDALTVVTQNIDDLHERAGLRRVIHMHGELLKALCRGCGARVECDIPLVDHPPCPRCGLGELRPDVVFFGEVPYHLDEIQAHLLTADLFVSIGTSGAVYPAAGFVQLARRAGARTLELNLEPSEGSLWFGDSRLGPASELVPRWVDEVLDSWSVV